MWAYAPMLLAATHFIVGLILLVRERGNMDGDQLGMALAAGRAGAAAGRGAGLLLDLRDPLRLTPVTTARLMLGWFSLSGILWMLFGSAAYSGLQDKSFLPLALGAGLAVKAMLSIGSPPGRHRQRASRSDRRPPFLGRPTSAGRHSAAWPADRGLFDHHHPIDACRQPPANDAGLAGQKGADLSRGIRE